MGRVEHSQNPQLYIRRDRNISEYVFKFVSLPLSAIPLRPILHFRLAAGTPFAIGGIQTSPTKSSWKVHLVCHVNTKHVLPGLQNMYQPLNLNSNWSHKNQNFTYSTSNTHHTYLDQYLSKYCVFTTIFGQLHNWYNYCTHMVHLAKDTNTLSRKLWILFMKSFLLDSWDQSPGCIECPLD